MKKKLNPAKIARIQERRASGATFEELAKEFKCAVGTVANALKRPATVAKPATNAPKPALSAPPDELPTTDDLRRSLAAQVRSLQADVEAAETPALRAATSRLLVATQQLLSRITPPDPTVAPPGMVLVPADEMAALGEQVEKRFGALIDEMFAGLPTCPTCGQPVAPTEDAG